MASSAPPTAGPASSPFDPFNQTFYLTGPDNTTVPVSVPQVDYIWHYIIGTSINYGSQIGACLLMLLVMLTLTSKSRFSRAATLINVASLLIGVIRCVLLAVYFTSSLTEFYALFVGDYSQVRRSDLCVSAVATFFSLPQLVLIEAALFLQAYSMIKMWPSLWRAVVLAMSVVVAVCAIGFKFASVVMRMRSTLTLDDSLDFWLVEVDLAFTATTIFWFCFIFIIRLVIHMWEYRSILPPMGSVSAMEVLVMTNGVLMLVPVIFAAIEINGLSSFESGSLVYTSVIVLLPLGSLIAQAMTRPDGYVQRTNTSGASGASGAHPGRNGSGHGGHGGAYSRAMTNTLNTLDTLDTVDSKTGIMHHHHHHHRNHSNGMSKTKANSGTWSHASDANSTNAMISGGIATQVRIQANQSTLGNTGMSGGSGAPNSHTRNNSLAAMEPVEKQLHDIDATPLSASDCRVWVDREVEVRRDMV
ncbi:pheromone alpha factor receptor [Sporothrix schenckii 1099-18]|uniref:Pheromone alpha factor receptor n=1 Tax=Sporothrix schenckii 1099-18 TaxID=1397361 RepID=A0A0F2M7E2_SPOSC|nr:pheromone alpha factor receptor [Sporothrix schenckii 1099-18]KJR84750.1 pheromone alpha factor receptor [Sporothrix schenckii 1099-18]